MNTPLHSHPLRRRGLLGRIRERLDRGLPWRLVHWMRLGDTQQVWYLRRLIRLLQIDLVVDVGGNRGQYAQLIRRRVGYSGALISIEPIPEAAADLRRVAAGDAQWAVVEAALGETAGRAALNVMHADTLSSLLEPSNAATDLLARDNTVARRVDVRVQTLDELLAAHPLAQGKQRIYLKLDVQGLELPVLRGAGAALARISALQAELSVIALYPGVAPYHEQMREIEALGFQLSFVPAHNYTQFPDMIDFDGHFVSRRVLQERGYLLRPAA
jgi:FkbM family methyltransferase